MWSTITATISDIQNWQAYTENHVCHQNLRHIRMSKLHLLSEVCLPRIQMLSTRYGTSKLAVVVHPLFLPTPPIWLDVHTSSAPYLDISYAPALNCHAYLLRWTGVVDLDLLRQKRKKRNCRVNISNGWNLKKTNSVKSGSKIYFSPSPGV